MRFVPIALSIVLLAALAPAQEPQTPAPTEGPKFQEILSSEPGYSLKVPEGWRTTPRSGEGPVIAFDAVADAKRFGARLQCGLYWIKRLSNPRAEAVFDRPSKKRNYDTDKATIVFEPMPHLVVEHEEGNKPMVDVFVYLVRHGRGLVFWASLERDGWKELSDEILGVAASADTSLGPWPPLPAGFRVEVDKRSGFRYLLEPAYKGDWRRVHAILTAEERRFAGEAGPLRKDPENPPTILLFRIQSDMSDLVPFVAQAGFDYYCEPTEHRLYMVDPPEKMAGEKAGEMMREITEFLYLHRFGDAEPEWYFRLQACLAEERALAGKSFPALSKRGFGTLPGTPRRFDTIYDEYRSINSKEMEPHLLTYAALFLKGEKKYVTAFEAFEKAFFKTGDYHQAALNTLLTFDPDQMKIDATEAAARVFKAPK